MQHDPRRIFENAVKARSRCEILPRTGGIVRAWLVRVERGGVVVNAPARRFLGGEEVRIWLPVGDRAYTFEASIIRSGVPVPDRSQDGLLLGFIDRFQLEGTPLEHANPQIELMPGNGRPIALLDAAAKLIHLDLTGMIFTLPSRFKLIFVAGSVVKLRLSAPGQHPVLATGRIRAVAPERTARLYDLTFESVDSPRNHWLTIDRLTSG